MYFPEKPAESKTDVRHDQENYDDYMPEKEHSIDI